MHASSSSPGDGSPGMAGEFQIEDKICSMYGAFAHGKSPFMGVNESSQSFDGDARSP